MKKFIITCICAISALGASATILFISSCGQEVYTVGPDYFKTSDDAMEYYMELDSILCDEEDEDVEDPGPTKN